ncbi:MAG TPA: energy transducer TonB [Dyadobacter sp.]|jgi:protein TonB|nr:energy transducer TonB [Dyadobacter sp.]
MKIPKQLKSKYAFHIQLIIWSVLLLCKTQIPSFSQTTTKRSEERVFTVVEKQPEFPGGENARKEFIAENLLTPKSTPEHKINGRVFISFIVNTDGSRQDVTILKSLSPEFDKEALRIINLMPTWTPGSQSGKLVRVKHLLPIEFR